MNALPRPCRRFQGGEGRRGSVQRQVVFPSTKHRHVMYVSRLLCVLGVRRLRQFLPRSDGEIVIEFFVVLCWLLGQGQGEGEGEGGYICPLNECLEGPGTGEWAAAAFAVLGLYLVLQEMLTIHKSPGLYRSGYVFKYIYIHI